MAGRLAQFVARVARPHLPAWPRLAPQPMPAAPVSTPAAAPSPFAKHLAKLRALSPELHPPDTPLGRLQHLRNWVRTRNGMLTANVLLGGAASAAFVNPAPSADASKAGEGAVRATLNSPFEEYGFTFTNWDALSPSSKTLAPILAVNTVIWGVWQMANFCRTERCVRFMEDHFTCSIWNWKNYRVHTLVTSMFSHLSFMHLLFNNVAIWSIGSTVHRDVGRDNFLITYFGGGVLGSLTSLIYKAVTRTANPSVGASAAGYALFAMFSMNHPESRLQIIFLPFFSFAAKYMFYGAVAFDATMLLLRRSFLDHAAHLGGAAMGLAAYYTLPPAPKAPGRRVYRPAVRGPHGY